MTQTAPVPFHLSLLGQTEKFTKTLANISRSKDRGLNTGLPEYEATHLIGTLLLNKRLIC